MDLEPYRFELVFTGLCLFVLEKTGATVLLVNATNPKRFAADQDLANAAVELPNPHFPQLSYSMTQQVRQGVVPRIPDRVVSGTVGEEIGICDLDGEELTIELSGPQSFQAGPLQEAPSISSLAPVRLNSLCNEQLPNNCVVTRIHFDRGTLETLRVGFAGLSPLEVDIRTIRTKGQPSGNPSHTIADQIVLRAEELTKPVKIRSDVEHSILLRPDADASGENLRPVRACLANYHRHFHAPADAAYDFLWFYELLEFTGLNARPSRIDLPVPVTTSASGSFTGGSTVCPPVRL